MNGYYTVVLPWVPRHLASEWHPTEETGPFSSLTRGCFATVDDAVAWAQQRLNGLPYTVTFVDGANDGEA